MEGLGLRIIGLRISSLRFRVLGLKVRGLRMPVSMLSSLFDMFSVCSHHVLFECSHGEGVNHSD